MAKKKNPFLEQMERERDKAFNAGFRTGVQWHSDMSQLTLHDPAVMGKDTFGKERSTKVHRATEERSDYYFDALDPRLPEADVFRDEMDKGLQAIFGADFVPFEGRYPWLKHCSYEKRVHKH